jgi:sugar lactone lactonase YvrE
LTAAEETIKAAFDGPTGIAVDPKGNVFVADTNNARIEKFSGTGGYLAAWESKGSVMDSWGAPNGIAIDRAGNIYRSRRFQTRCG